MRARPDVNAVAHVHAEIATLFTLVTASLNGGTPAELGTGSSGRITDDGSQLDLVVILTNGERFDFLGATYLRTEKIDASASLIAPGDRVAGADPEDSSFARLAATLAR